MIDVPIFVLSQISDERWGSITVSKHEQLSFYLSPRQYAKKWGVHYNSVLRWVSHGLLPFSIRNAGKKIWFMIPADVKPPKCKRGPKNKKKV